MRLTRGSRYDTEKQFRRRHACQDCRSTRGDDEIGYERQPAAIATRCRMPLVPVHSRRGPRLITTRSEVSLPRASKW